MLRQGARNVNPAIATCRLCDYFSSTVCLRFPKGRQQRRPCPTTAWQTNGFHQHTQTVALRPQPEGMNQATIFCSDAVRKCCVGDYRVRLISPWLSHLPGSDRLRQNSLQIVQTRWESY